MSNLFSGFKNYSNVYQSHRDCVINLPNDAIKLASNENPLGPSPKAIELVKKCLLNTNRYPDSSGHTLRNKLVLQNIFFLIKYFRHL